MEANEAPKSKFIYPNKLYARTNNNITLDISYAPQTLEAVEYTRTDAFIEKACDAYCKVCGHFSHTVPTHICRHDCSYFSDFKKHMEDK